MKLIKKRRFVLNLICYIVIFINIISVGRVNATSKELDVNEAIQLKTKASMYILAKENSVIRKEHGDWLELTATEIAAIDKNGNKEVDTIDILILKQHILAMKNSKVREQHPEWILYLKEASEMKKLPATQETTEIKKEPTAPVTPKNKSETISQVNTEKKDKPVVSEKTQTRKTPATSVKQETQQPAKVVDIKTIKLNKTNLTMYEEDKQGLKVTIIPSNATNKSIVWNSDNLKVVTVDKNGKITAKKAGTAKITAKSKNGKTATCKIVVKHKEIYDVILFWGQSNMVGYCGNNNVFDENKPDSRYDYKNADIVSKFSIVTNIDKEFISNAVNMNWIKLEQKSKTAFEYNYKNNKLVEITKNTKYLGEKLLYNAKTKKLNTASSKYSIQRSYGTNMIPEFCRKYYELTGHKVVAVFAANGGEKISNFLPSNDKDYGDKINKQMIYEAMVCKYQAAVKYLEKNKYNIGNKLYVVFQGESDVSAKTSTKEYKRIFKKIHNNLKRIGIQKGAIIETSRAPGTYTMARIEKVHKAQKELIKENKDIILGSSFPYDTYVSTKTDYKNCNTKITKFRQKRLNYDQALTIAKHIMCYNNNAIHFTSSALCQIGKETAQNLAKSIK